MSISDWISDLFSSDLLPVSRARTDLDGRPLPRDINAQSLIASRADECEALRERAFGRWTNAAIRYRRPVNDSEGEAIAADVRQNLDRMAPGYIDLTPHLARSEEPTSELQSLMRI